MKATRHFILTAVTLISLGASLSAPAQTTAAPTKNLPTVVVPSTALSGVPSGIRNMITSFEVTRDRFLANQELIYSQLRHATTPEQREQIRLQLQANRKAFLTALTSFRTQLGTELAALKGKISHEEFLRIIDAAHNAATEGGLSHHRGH